MLHVIFYMSSVPEHAADDSHSDCRANEDDNGQANLILQNTLSHLDNLLEQKLPLYGLMQMQ